MELTFEELVSNIDNLLADCPFQPAELAAQAEAENQYRISMNSLQEVESECATGVSRELMLTVESIAPGSLPERYPVNSFTLLKSGTNLNFALEAIGTGKLAAIAAIVAAIFAGLYKLAKWVIALLRGSKGINETAMKEAAQARTAAETVNEAVKQTNGPLASPKFDINEISKIREEVFLSQVRPKISKALYLLVFEQRPLQRKLYSALCSQLVAGKNDLFSSVENSINSFNNRLKEFLHKSSKDESGNELDITRFFDQPLLQVVYAMQDTGFVQLDVEFQGYRLSTVGKQLQSVNHEQYLRTVAAALELVNGPLGIKMTEDDECMALSQTSVFFNANQYNSNQCLDELEATVKWFGGNIVIPDDTDVRLSRVETALTDLRKTMVDFENAAKKDANAALLGPALVNHLNSFQQDIHFLTRCVYTVRALQREMAVFGRLMATGETACLNYLKALLEKDAEGKLVDLIAKKRKEHQAVLSRFKGYLG